MYYVFPAICVKTSTNTLHIYYIYNMCIFIYIILCSHCADLLSHYILRNADTIFGKLKFYLFKIIVIVICQNSALSI